MSEGEGGKLESRLIAYLIACRLLSALKSACIVPVDCCVPYEIAVSVSASKPPVYLEVPVPNDWQALPWTDQTNQQQRKRSTKRTSSSIRYGEKTQCQLREKQKSKNSTRLETHYGI
jgi:hypothetical protein